MTCILGLEDKGQVWLGSDSYLGDSDSRDILDRPKWFRKGPLVLAYYGGFREAQVLEHTLTIRQPRKNEKPMAYLTNAVARVVREGMEANGVHTTSGGEMEAGFLVVYSGLLYTLQEDFSVVRSRRGYAAMGVGSAYALGALAALRTRLPPREAITEALQHTCEWCPQVTRPITVEVFG